MNKAIMNCSHIINIKFRCSYLPLGYDIQTDEKSEICRPTK
jgi:hypothetical protein